MRLKVEATLDYAMARPADVLLAIEAAPMEEQHLLDDQLRVRRGYAHVMAAFARAAGIPARLVSAYAWQLQPQDFHAVVDVWLDGRWRLIDASGLAPADGLVRIAVGRDATDIAFMPIFGQAELVEQKVSVERLD